eukprot:SAG11_NODE_36254_length_262_cov_1.269939_1_plen_29_part_10
MFCSTTTPLGVKQMRNAPSAQSDYSGGWR